MLFVSMFFLGVIIGSFLNMLIYRLPLQISLFKPSRSICPKCKNIIKWYENIPLLSYLILKAKCGSCNASISINYFIVELFTGFISVVLYLKLGICFELVVLLLLFYTLIVLSFIDLQYKAVMDYLLILTLIFSFFVDGFDYKMAMMFAGFFVLLELFITFYIQNIKARILNDQDLREQKAMGDGDLPIIAIIGGVLSLKFGLVAIFLSALFALIPSLLNNLLKNDIETPFIPFLSLSLFIVYVWGEDILRYIDWISIC